MKGSAERAEHGAAHVRDPVVEAYKKDLDRSLLRENLKLSVEERLIKLSRFQRFLEGVRATGRRQP